MYTQSEWLSQHWTLMISAILKEFTMQANMHLILAFIVSSK